MLVVLVCYFFKSLTNELILTAVDDKNRAYLFCLPVMYWIMKRACLRWARVGKDASSVQHAIVPRTFSGQSKFGAAMVSKADGTLLLFSATDWWSLSCCVSRLCLQGALGRSCCSEMMDFSGGSEWQVGWSQEKCIGANRASESIVICFGVWGETRSLLLRGL